MGLQRAAEQSLQLAKAVYQYFSHADLGHLYQTVSPVRWFNRSGDGYSRIDTGSRDLPYSSMSVFDKFPKVYNVYFLAIIGKYLLRVLEKRKILISCFPRSHNGWHVVRFRYLVDECHYRFPAISVSFLVIHTKTAYIDHGSATTSTIHQGFLKELLGPLLLQGLLLAQSLLVLSLTSLAVEMRSCSPVSGGSSEPACRLPLMAVQC